jgi:hypothetical protein
VATSSATTGVAAAVGLATFVEARVAVLTVAGEATAFEVAVEVETALGEVGVSVTALLFDATGVVADLYSAPSP